MCAVCVRSGEKVTGSLGLTFDWGYLPDRYRPAPSNCLAVYLRTARGILVPSFLPHHSSNTLPAFQSDMASTETLAIQALGHLDTVSDAAMRRSQLLTAEHVLSQALCRLRSELNATLPISHLPIEILEMIFAQCVSGWSRDSNFSANSLHPPQDAFPWMGVCRAWRDIGVGSRRLWRDLDLGRPTGVLAVFLERCWGDVPLWVRCASPGAYGGSGSAKGRTINGRMARDVNQSGLADGGEKHSGYGRGTRSIEEMLERNGYRVEKVDVFLRSDLMMALFKSLLSSYSPSATLKKPLGILTSLTLKALPSSHQAVVVPLPSWCFATLEKLDLDRVSVPWEESRDVDGAWARLQEISLKGLGGCATTSITSPQSLSGGEGVGGLPGMEMLLWIIESAGVRLEKVRVEGYVCPLQTLLPWVDEEKKRVVLGSLKDFTFCSCQRGVVGFVMGRIGVPFGAKVHLSTGSLEELAEVIPGGIPWVLPSPLLHEEGMLLRLSKYGLTLWTDSDKKEKKAWSETGRRLLFSLISSCPLRGGVFGGLDGLFPRGMRGRIGTLEINTGLLDASIGVASTASSSSTGLHPPITNGPMAGLSGGTLRTMLGFELMRSIESLYVGFNNVHDLLGALTPVDVDDPSPSLLPRLSHLSFNKPCDLWWDFGEAVMPSVVDIVVRRALSGVGRLDVTEFIKCGGVAGGNMLLKALEELAEVGKVVCLERGMK